MMPQHPLPKHIPALDGMRGLAVLVVIFGHFAIMNNLADMSFAAGLMVSLIGPSRGVDIFFVLSGFLITGILIDCRSQPHFFRNFIMRRAVRIFPLYYLYLCIIFGLLTHLTANTQSTLGQASTDQLWYWLYGSNFLASYHGFSYSILLDHLWSLAVEEQFYLIWPIVVYYLSPSRFKVACIAVVLVAGSLRLGLYALDAPWTAAYCLLVTRCDALAAGGLVAILIRSGVLSVAMRRGNRLLLLAASIAFLVMSGLTITMSYYSSTIMTFDRWVMLALSIGMLNWCIDPTAPRWFRGFMEHAAMRFFGKYSYSMYLFSPLIMLIAERLLGDPHAYRHLTYIAMKFVLSFGGTIGFALLSWNLFEKHWLKLKRFFPTDSEPAGTGGKPVTREPMSAVMPTLTATE